MKSKNILIIYSFIVCLVLTLVGVLSAKSTSQLLSSLVYLPLLLYFGTRLLHTFTKKKRVPSPKIIPTPLSPATEYSLVDNNVMDHNKRVFLKLIGSTGFGLLLMALFTKKAQAAFFGSVPGPGTVALKDTAGNKIDPAEKHPTDGYEITQVDDAGSPTYYGFVKKTDEWYILREESSGAYRYTKGSANFNTNWTNRASLTYDYFNSVF